MSDEDTAIRVKKRLDRSAEGYTAEERQDLRRSFVRVGVTYAAAVYVFVLGPVAAWLVFDASTVNVGTGENGTMAILAPNIAAGKDLFLSILPIATGIVTFWFAARGNKSAEKPE